MTVQLLGGLTVAGQSVGALAFVGRVGGGALSDLGADLRPPLKLDVQFSRIQLSWMGLRSLKRRYQRD